MDVKQGRAMMAFYAVDVFIEAHEADLPKTSSSGARSRFSRGLTELVQYVRTQEAGGIQTQQLTRVKEAKRDALVRDFMAPIARIAQLESARVPDLQPLKMPRGDPGVEKLLGHAAGMLAVVSRHVEVFVELGLAPTVVEDMQTAIDAVIGTITDRSVKVGERGGATEGVIQMLQELNKQRAILDSFVCSELHDKPEELANWQLVKRVEKLPGRRGKRADPE